MKRTTIKDRTKKAIDTFFEDENSSEFSVSAISGSGELIQQSTLEIIEQRADKVWDLIKKIFIFAPGVLFLHLTVGSVLTFVHMIGFTPMMIFMLLAGSFMVWTGLGDLKNKKHLLLPLSVVSLSLLLGIPFTFLSPDLISYYIYFYICSLPLFFIAPILTKSYLDRTNRI